MKTFKTVFNGNLQLATQYSKWRSENKGTREEWFEFIYSNTNKIGKGLGNTAAGDGGKYYGRGLIQLTGKTNYTWFAASVEITPEEAAEYTQTFEGAAQSACWFWETNNLNQWADKGDILTLTKRINGGTIGLEDRIKHHIQYRTLYIRLV
jgi:predicted chitinase